MARRLRLVLWGVLVAAGCRTVGEPTERVRHGAGEERDCRRGIILLAAPTSRPHVSIAPFSVTCAAPRPCEAELRRLACAIGADGVIKESVNLVPRDGPTPALACVDGNRAWPILTGSCVLEDPDSFAYLITGQFVRLPAEPRSSTPPAAE